MAATDLFDRFVKQLTENERQVLSRMIASYRNDLQGARSEEARVRIAEEFIRSAHDFLRAENG
jgi:adenylate cyclase